MARDRNLSPPLAKQILVYPMLDYKNTRPVPALSKWLVWNEEANLTGWGALLGDRLESGDVSHYASPTYAKDLAGLPSTYIDCGTLDLFRDEDTDYAKRLIEAGVDVELHLVSVLAFIPVQYSHLHSLMGFFSFKLTFSSGQVYRMLSKS